MPSAMPNILRRLAILAIERFIVIVPGNLRPVDQVGRRCHGIVCSKGIIRPVRRVLENGRIVNGYLALLILSSAPLRHIIFRYSRIIPSFGFVLSLGVQPAITPMARTAASDTEKIANFFI